MYITITIRGPVQAEFKTITITITITIPLSSSVVHTRTWKGKCPPIWWVWPLRCIAAMRSTLLLLGLSSCEAVSLGPSTALQPQAQSSDVHVFRDSTRPEAEVSVQEQAAVQQAAKHVSRVVKNGDLVRTGRLEPHYTAVEGPRHEPLRLLIQASHVERIPLLLEAYSGVRPWTIMMLVPQDDVASCGMLCANSCACIGLPVAAYADYLFKYHEYALAPLADGSSDLLYIHADMWISPAFYDLVQTNRRTILLPRELVPVPQTDEPTEAEGVGGSGDGRCFTPDNINVRWSWWGNLSQACSAALRSDSFIQSLGTCCFGWVDMLHLPKAVQLPFAKLVTGPLSGANQEGAILTAARALAAQNATTLNHVKCLGSCCQGSRNPPEMVPWSSIASGDYLCAHPVQLQEETDAVAAIRSVQGRLQQRARSVSRARGARPSPYRPRLLRG